MLHNDTVSRIGITTGYIGSTPYVFEVGILIPLSEATKSKILPSQHFKFSMVISPDHNVNVI